MNKPIALTLLLAGSPAFSWRVVRPRRSRSRDQLQIPSQAHRERRRLGQLWLCISLNGDRSPRRRSRRGRRGHGPRRLPLSEDPGGTDGWGLVKSSSPKTRPTAISLAFPYPSRATTPRSGRSARTAWDRPGRRLLSFIATRADPTIGARSGRSLPATRATMTDSGSPCPSTRNAHRGVGRRGRGGHGPRRGLTSLPRTWAGPTNWGQVVKLVSTDPGDSDRFGYAVALEGDFAVVGAPREDGDGTDRGAAYLFSRDLGGTDAWGLTKARSGRSDRRFLVRNALDVDGSLAVVGSAWDDGAGTNRGAVYVFGRDVGSADLLGPDQEARRQ